ncbi:hypothetical protein AAVH_38842, partial [Aphelenchoides avenae]
MSVDFFDSLAVLAPTIFVKNFCLGKRALDENVDDEEVLRALQAFAGLKTLKSDAGIHPLDKRNEKKEKGAGVTLVFGELGLNNNVVTQNALMEYCFGACDEQYAERDRFLSVEFLESLKRDFLKRWIEKAEATVCRHKLTLDISIYQGFMPQDTAALDRYKHDGQIGGE